MERKELLDAPARHQIYQESRVKARAEDVRHGGFLGWTQLNPLGGGLPRVLISTYT